MPGCLRVVKPHEICEAIWRIQPQLIVNAAAYTAVDHAEKAPGLTQAINSDAPEIMTKKERKSARAWRTIPPIPQSTEPQIRLIWKQSGPPF